MTDKAVIEIITQAIILAAKLSGPILAVSLAVGLGIGLIQSATQVQEQTLTFVPKLAGIALVIVLGGNWMLQETIVYTQDLFAMIPSLLAQ